MTTRLTVPTARPYDVVIGNGVHEQLRGLVGFGMGVMRVGDGETALRSGWRLALDGGGLDAAGALDFHGMSHCDTAASLDMVKEALR
jgi:hypothetical protein